MWSLRTIEKRKFIWLRTPKAGGTQLIYFFRSYREWKQGAVFEFSMQDLFVWQHGAQAAAGLEESYVQRIGLGDLLEYFADLGDFAVAIKVIKVGGEFCVAIMSEAWNILETVHEGTSKVKMSRLQLLTTKFENLRMNDDETIQEFHMTILDYDNQFDALGEKIPEEKLVRKMLRSLPKKFDMKVTAIEEAKDITKMKLDELLGSLQTYEVATNERMDKKTKSIAFVSNAEEEDQQSDTESENSISDAMVLLGKQFNKVLKIMDKRPKTSAADTGRNTYRNFRKPMSDEKTALNKSVQCHECEGYGHIRTECATFLKKQKMGLTVSWSDEDSEGEADTAKFIHALTGVCTSDTESCDEELTFDELAESYKELCRRSEEVCRISEK
ncbi:unnamed protein product [Trifolium pratense]|uniref:Uncharacterized protein n=1 Tax=Trifolium pratense TaxID=57577 RepID=A0ACB0KXM8_TRIPR|nr:unnamed protein product [Trifolium pratense]